MVPLCLKAEGNEPCVFSRNCVKENLQATHKDRQCCRAQLRPPYPSLQGGPFSKPLYCNEGGYCFKVKVLLNSNLLL